MSMGVGVRDLEDLLEDLEAGEAVVEMMEYLDLVEVVVDLEEEDLEVDLGGWILDLAEEVEVSEEEEVEDLEEKKKTMEASVNFVLVSKEWKMMARKKHSKLPFKKIWQGLLLVPGVKEYAV